MATDDRDMASDMEASATGVYEDGPAITPTDSYEWCVDQILNKREDTALELLAQCHIGIQLYFLAGQLQIMNQQVFNLITEPADAAAEGES